MQTNSEVQHLYADLIDAYELLFRIRSQPETEPEAIVIVEQNIERLITALRQAGEQIEGFPKGSDFTLLRKHIQTIQDQARVRVAIAGDLYGDIIVKLLPRRVPAFPSEEDIRKGQALIEHMPVPPQALPSRPYPFLLSGNFPLRHNPLFVGRDSMLAELAQRLKPVGAKAAISTGIGGVGKTTLAAEFAHRYGAFFAGGVFWISCADPTTIETQIATYGGPGWLEVWQPNEELSLDQRVDRVRRQWESDLPRLVIFDNCDDWVDASGEQSAEELLRKWIPPTGGCRVLVTSRRQVWSPELGVIDIFLDVLARPASITLLQSLVKHLSDSEADRVAAALGDLPLALYLAGGYLQRYRQTSVDQFLSELARIDPTKHPALRGDGTSYAPARRHARRQPSKAEIEAELNVGRVFALSFDHLQASDPADAAAMALLARAACLAPNVPFARPLLLATLKIDEAEGQFTTVDGLERLVGLGMLEKQDRENLRIHRLVSGFAAQAINDPQSQTQVEDVLVEQANDLVNKQIASSLYPLIPHLRHSYQRVENMHNLRTLQLGHALAHSEVETFNYAEAELLFRRTLSLNRDLFGDKDHLTAVSLNELGMICFRQANYSEAEQLVLEALEIAEQLVAKEDPLTIKWLNDLATVYKEQGRYKEAEPIMKRSLALREAIWGKEHAHVATSLSSLASLYQLQGKYREAAPLFERALAINRKELGEEHPVIVKNLSELAQLYQLQARYAEAEALFMQALALSERLFGDDHPETAVQRSVIAGFYQSQARYAEAETLFKQAVEVIERVLGKAHPKTAMAIAELGHLYLVQARYADAETSLNTALSIFQQSLGLNHHKTIGIKHALASLYQAQGRYSDALSLHQKLVQQRRQNLGEKHPETIASLANLATLYHLQANYTEASEIFKQVLQTSRQLWGDTHPKVATILENLAGSYQEQGHYHKAERLFKQALQIREQSFGHEHPDVANSLNNLAALYQIQARYAEAEPLLRRALAINQDCLGEVHPNYARNLNNLAVLQKTLGNYAEAEEGLKRSLRLYQQAFGNQHSETAISLNNLGSLYQTQARYAEAESVYTQALAIREAVLGMQHPDTAISMANLAHIYQLQARYSEAEALLKRALQSIKRGVGDTHPSTLQILNNLASLYQTVGRYQEALPLYQRVLELRQKQLGQEHPDTATSLNNLAQLYQLLARTSEACELWSAL